MEESKNGQQVVFCKKCGSNKVEETSLKMTLLVGGFITFSLGFWIPFIGWFLMIPIGLIMMVMGFIALFIPKKDYSMMCQDCKHITKVSKEERDEFNKQVS